MYLMTHEKQSSVIVLLPVSADASALAPAGPISLFLFIIAIINKGKDYKIKNRFVKNNSNVFQKRTTSKASSR